MMIRTPLEFVRFYAGFRDRPTVVDPTVIKTSALSIYVYGGQQPLLVVEDDGQNPVGVLSHWLMWQIEVEPWSFMTGILGDNTARTILQNPKPFTHYPILGHKSSYGYAISHVAMMQVFDEIHEVDQGSMGTILPTRVGLGQRITA